MSEQPSTAADRAAMIDAGQLPPAPWSDEERARLSQLYPGMRYDEGQRTPGHRGSLFIGGVPITGVQGVAFTSAPDPWADEIAVKCAPMQEITIEGTFEPADLMTRCFVCGIRAWIFRVQRGALIPRPGARPVAVDICEDCVSALAKMAADEETEMEVQGG